MPDEPIAGRYRLLEPLGRGAMSSVWLAEDEELGRRVAVKMLAPNADRERFAREARAVAALSHPNICALFDYGEADGRPFMVLEHLPNGSLEDRLRASAPFADGDTRLLAAEVAAGLAHAHERGLVHRDLKPANILFDAEDRPKIADFGIARMGGSGTLTEAGTVLGTATYISPEQASGAPAGPASDVYSFGVILFRMLTGRLPFASQNAMELVRMHRDAPAPAVEEVRADAPADLTALVAAALRKDPAARPADGAALLAALGGGRLVAPDETAATRILAAPPPSPAPRRRRRTPAVLAALALLLLVAGGAVALALTRNGDSTPPAPTTAPGLELPSVPTSSTAPPASTETTATTERSPTTTARTTTAPTTTAPTTTAAATTTPATTARTTTAPPPTTTATLPTTTEPPPTTTEPLPTTTAAVTTAPTTTTTITVP